jgi:hypothetical protein
VYQQSTVGVDGSGIACQYNRSNSNTGNHKKTHQQAQQFFIKAVPHPGFLPDLEAHNLVVNRAGHNARTDDFECHNNDDELLVCHLILDIQADSFDLEETAYDPSRQSEVSTISIITPSTRLLYDANPRLGCRSNNDSDSEITLDEFAFSCPILDGLIQDVISANQTVFGIANGTSFGPCNIQVGTDQIRTTVRL